MTNRNKNPIWRKKAKKVCLCHATALNLLYGTTGRRKFPYMYFLLTTSWWTGSLNFKNKPLFTYILWTRSLNLTFILRTRNVTSENIFIKRLKDSRLFPVLDTLLTCSNSFKQLLHILKIFPKKNENLAARVNFFSPPAWRKQTFFFFWPYATNK